MDTENIILSVTAVFILIYLIALAVSYSTGTLLFSDYNPPIDETKNFNYPYGKSVIPITNNCTVRDTRNGFVRAINAFTGYLPPADGDTKVFLGTTELNDNKDILSLCKATCAKTAPGCDPGSPGPTPCDPLYLPCLDKFGAKIPAPPKPSSQ